jgi:hypothetical protein
MSRLNVEMFGAAACKVPGRPQLRALRQRQGPRPHALRPRRPRQEPGGHPAQCGSRSEGALHLREEHVQRRARAGRHVPEAPGALRGSPRRPRLTRVVLCRRS